MRSRAATRCDRGDEIQRNHAELHHETSHHDPRRKRNWQHVAIEYDKRGGARKRTVAGASAPTYTVQVSTDDGRTWQTAGFALKEPQVTIDRQMLGDASAVRVRVTATNGFESKSTETTIKM